MQIKTKTREALRSYARTVGYRIRNRRKQLNLTMPEFQHRLDLLGLKAASSTILGWENGNRSVQLYLIPVIAAALNMSVMSMMAKPPTLKSLTS